MRAAERAERNAEVLKLFLAGHNYREIGLLQGLKPAQAEAVVKAELAKQARRRLLLADEALAIYQERFERLYQQAFERAEAGDQRAAEMCERMLARNARLFGLAEEINPSSLPAPTTTAAPVASADERDDGPADELSKLRAARTGA